MRHVSRRGLDIARRSYFEETDRTTADDDGDNRHGAVIRSANYLPPLRHLSVAAQEAAAADANDCVLCGVFEAACDS